MKLARFLARRQKNVIDQLVLQRIQFFLFLMLILDMLVFSANLVAQIVDAGPPSIPTLNRSVQKAPIEIDSKSFQLSSVQWESLGFSADGKFFANITYGVEHDLLKVESHFFARLSIFQLYGKSDGSVVFERTLRRSGPLKNRFIARSIMQDLLRRESKKLRKFQIEALEQGKILLSHREMVDQLEESINLQENAELLTAPLIEPPVAKDSINVAFQELLRIQEFLAIAMQQTRDSSNILDRIYTVFKNANTTIFQLKQLRLDGSNSLRGQVIAVQSQGFPHRYSFQQNWNTLLQRNLQENRQLNLRPVFITLSPGELHLLLTVQVYTNDIDGNNTGKKDVQDIKNTITGQKLEDDNNYAFVTFFIQVY